ncbi:MAG: hypothetical protein KDA96_21125, partial [Planctomycetaceae bacterium]|nr:hypothetical protein [Planctomycetaceae bacterium]
PPAVPGYGDVAINLPSAPELRSSANNPPLPQTDAAEKPRPRWGEEVPPAVAGADQAGADKAGPRPDWGAGGLIPYRSRDGVAVGPPGCPVVISGRYVWHKEQQELISELEGEFEGSGTSTLSPDGKLFAAALKSPNQQDTAVRVWDTATGKEKFVAQGEAERFSDTILLSNDRLYIGGRLSNELRVWDCTTGEQLKSLAVPEAKFGHGSSAVSQDGEYLAVTADDRLVVVRTSSGRQAAVMENPAVMPRERNGESLIIRDNKIVSSRSAHSDSTFVFAWMQSLEFSPDMEELAGVSTHPAPRVMCWNNRGKLVFDRPLYTQRRAFWENTLQWFPDRSAWLIENEVFHRESGRVVLSVRGGFASDTQLFVYDNNHLMGTFPDSPNDLKVREIPWDLIHASLNAMSDGNDALLRPGLPVRVEVNLGELRGDQQTTVNMIQSAIQRRLARDEIPVAAQGAAVFRLKFAEAAGDTLPIYERQSPFDFRGRDTGQKMTEAKGTLVVELLIPGQETPIWRDVLQAISSRSFREDITEATVRDSMLSSLQAELNDLDFPYYIPKSDQLLALPIVID